MLRFPSRFTESKSYKLFNELTFFNQQKFEKEYAHVIQFFLSIKRILFLFLGVLYFCHFIGCFWFYLARATNFPSDCWVVQGGFMDKSWQEQYLISIYWAMTTVSSVGYGDISAGNDLEMFVGMIIMILGTAFYAYAIGSLTSLLEEMNTEN